MPATETGDVTITAPAGAGLAAVADQINDIRSIFFDINRAMVFITQNDGRVLEYEYGTVATVTYTIANNNATIVIST